MNEGIAVVQAPDADALLRLWLGMGWTPTRAETERRAALAGDGIFLARDAAEAVVGSVMCTVWSGHLAWIGGLAVLPSHRRRGIGRALLQRALEHTEKAGAPLVGLDATDASRPLYEAHGFRSVGHTTRWIRPSKAPRPEPGPSGRFAIYPVSSCEVMELLDYDRPRFGTSRGPLLADLMGRFPQRSFVAVDRDTGAFSGFVLGMAGRVGPLVADAPKAAAWLLWACERAGTPPRVVANGLNPAAEKLFEAAGYRPELRCTRMVRGGDMPGDASRTFAVSGWSTG